MRRTISVILVLSMLLTGLGTVILADDTPSSVSLKFDSSQAVSYFFGANNVKSSSVEDNDYGRVIKLTTLQAGMDPYVSFNYKRFASELKQPYVSADTYKVVVFKIKQSRCTNSTFELFYVTGDMPYATFGYSRTSVFDNSDKDWQYVIFNLTDADKWEGSINSFRIDFMMSAADSGESISIGEIIFFKSMDDVTSLSYFGGDDPRAVTDEENKKAGELLSKAYDPVPSVSESKITAANEDSDIDLWFDHAYSKTPEGSTASTGMNTYVIRMARNEIEGAQFLLSSKTEKTGLTARLSTFKDSAGNTLKHKICYGYYFDDVEGESIPDPIPELYSSFDLKAGKSKMFLIKVFSSEDSPSGLYSSTLTICDNEGNEIKKANVYAYVWNFTLPVASNCKILSDLSWWNIYSANPPWLYAGDDGQTYAAYYDYLLENKVNAYNLPYLNTNKGETNPYTDKRIRKYLDDPRVQAFNPVGFGFENFNEERVQKAYDYLSEKEEWLEKAYFYPVDEPLNIEMLNKLVASGEIVKRIFGENYKLIAPMALNLPLDSESRSDYFSYVQDVVNIWCPHNYFFNTLADFKYNPSIMFQYYTATLEKNLGTFISRMKKEQEEGDEVWWYTTRFPHHPEITLSIDDNEVEHRILFWQQKLYDIDGYLYYMSNDWHQTFPWDKLHETSNLYPYNVYGNGVLVYNGFMDSNGDEYISREHYDELADKSYDAFPVGSLRLESVRDGAEDFDYFTILDELYGEGTSDLIIKQVTTSLGEYNADPELYNTLRIATGNLISQKYSSDTFNAHDWALDELKKADAIGIIPSSIRFGDLKEPITREEFAAVSIMIYEYLNGEKASIPETNPFTDTDNADVLKAYAAGITNGTGKTTFSPNDKLNREQAATMLTRVYKKLIFDGWTLENDSSFDDQFKGMFTPPAAFDDDSRISSWAKDSVYFMASKGIINGTGQNRFSPRAVTEEEKNSGYATATREQALLIAYRMAQKLK